MNIFKLKFKLHRLINYLFYLIIFSIGFLCGKGTLDLKNILFMNVYAKGYNVEVPKVNFFYTENNMIFSYGDVDNLITAMGSGTSTQSNLNSVISALNAQDLNYYWVITYQPNVSNLNGNNFTLNIIFGDLPPIIYGLKSENDLLLNSNTKYAIYEIINPSSIYFKPVFTLNYKYQNSAYTSINGGVLRYLNTTSNSLVPVFSANSSNWNYANSVYSIKNGYSPILFAWGSRNGDWNPQIINKNNNSIKYDLVSSENSNIYKPNIEPSFSYIIENGSVEGKKLIFNFENFKEDMYVNVEDLYSGSSFTIDDFPDRTNYIIDNISFDSIYYVNIYRNGDLWNAYTIDIANELNINGNDRFVNFALLKDVDDPRFVFSFENTKSGDTCFIDFEGKHTEVDCGEQYGYSVNEGDIHYNSSALFSVYNNNNKVFFKGYTVNLFDNLPSIYFSNSLDKQNNSSIVDIIVSNLGSNDLIQYSYDNIIFYDLESKRLNSLTFYNNSHLYVNVLRNNNIVASGYFYVNLDKFNNSSINEFNSNGTNIFNVFKDITKSVDFNILGYFTEYWNLLKQSRLFLIINISLVGSLCVYLLKAFRR